MCFHHERLMTVDVVCGHSRLAQSGMVTSSEYKINYEIDCLVERNREGKLSASNMKKSHPKKHGI